MTSTSGMREALEAADYLINRLDAVWRGKSVRDLDEAYVRYERAKAALSAVPAPLSDMENHVVNSVANQAESVPQQEREVYYLESILRQLREYKDFIGSCEVLAPSIGSEVLADNVDWLDCHIEHIKGRPLTHEATIKLCLDAVSNCASLDENGYICEKAVAMRAVRSLNSQSSALKND